MREGRHSQTKFFLRMDDLPLKDGPHAGGDGGGAPALDMKGMRKGTMKCAGFRGKTRHGYRTTEGA